MMNHWVLELKNGERVHIGPASLEFAFWAEITLRSYGYEIDGTIGAAAPVRVAPGAAAGGGVGVEQGGQAGGSAEGSAAEVWPRSVDDDPALWGAVDAGAPARQRGTGRDQPSAAGEI
jgi:hypothetical protein